MNGASHLRGNVYVQYSSLDSAVLAHQSINGRYFAGKQISCDFINVTRWKVAICGEYMKSRYKTCNRGTACNFIHCFRNPGGDYEWANSDRPPPKYWVEKMVALFGYSDAYEKQIMDDNSAQLTNSRVSMTDSWRYAPQRSRSTDRCYSSFTDSGRRYDNENHALKRTSQHRPSGEDNVYLQDVNQSKNTKSHIESDEELMDMDGDMYHLHRRRSRQESRDQKNQNETEFEGHLLERGRNRETECGSTRKSSSQRRKEGVPHEYGDFKKKIHEVAEDQSTRVKDRESYHDSRRSSGHKRKVGYDNKDRKSKAHDSDGEWSDSIRKDDEHRTIRKCLVHIGNASKGLKEQESSARSCTAELSEHLLDKDAEEDHSHASKRLKNWDKVADKLDGNRAPAQDLKHNKGQFSLKPKEADSPVKILKSYGTPEPCILDQDDVRCTSDVQIDKHDRWEPEPWSVEKHKIGGKAGSSESHDSGWPINKGRDESCQFDSKLYYDDKVGKLEHYESGEVTSSKHQKSRRQSANGNSERDSGKRSRGSSQSGYRRRSNSSDEATNSSDDNKESRRRRHRHHVSYKSSDRKCHHKKS